MSRKNLARTVIEGGRYRHNQFRRNESHRIERATTRAWIDQISADTDEADYTSPPRRPPVRKLFYDKLAPATRWLDSQVGRPWNKVYSELCATFDRRNLAGMHVVDAHLVGEVWRGDLSQRRRDFFVDAHGILRRERFAHQRWALVRQRLVAWVNGRRAALTYMGWWWFRLVGSGRCFDYPCPAKHAVIAGERYHATQLVPVRALTNRDRRRLDRLPVELRDEIVTRWPPSR